jgi:hypothetical protein
MQPPRDFSAVQWRAVLGVTMSLAILATLLAARCGQAVGACSPAMRSLGMPRSPLPVCTSPGLHTYIVSSCASF